MSDLSAIRIWQIDGVLDAKSVLVKHGMQFVFESYFFLEVSIVLEGLKSVELCSETFFKLTVFNKFRYLILFIAFCDIYVSCI